jgi:hypothetical protein
MPWMQGYQVLPKGGRFQMTKEKIGMDADKAWAHLRHILRPMWHYPSQYVKYTGAEFAEEFGEHLFGEDAEWIRNNVAMIQHQLDGYGVKFTWE